MANVRECDFIFCYLARGPLLRAGLFGFDWLGRRLLDRNCTGLANSFRSAPKIFRGIGLKGYLHYKFLFCILYSFAICLSNSFLHISSKELSLLREVDGGICLQDIREAVMYRLRKGYY